jgi:dipeptidase D
MNYVVNGRKPESVFRYFEEISAIPRGSFNESGIADYLCAFAKDRGLVYHRDEANNVLIKSPASHGMEGRPALLLQGHTDMVCEKNADVEHDFLRDPLKLYVEGNQLRAKGTTLGADNGIAVAMMLALLDGELADHPALECLFTTAEEVGLNGAHAFDYSLLDSRRMLNLDSEALGVVTAGCAGGLRSDLTLEFMPRAFAGECVHLQIKGLMGGHSGENINCGRANANKLMGRLLALLSEKTETYIVSLSGGSKDNAIPRECEALIAVSNADEAMELLTDAAEALAEEMGRDDRGFTVICESAEPSVEMMNAEDSRRVIALLNVAQNGVIEMSRQVAGLVEYSRNLGVIRFEDGKITFVFSTRSSIEERLDASIRELNLLAALTGCKTRHHSRYPGWSYANVSDIRDRYLATYKTVTGREATVNVIHAGLECGVIRSHVPDMDMISIGPDMKDIHSPNEALDLDSVESFWKVLAELIPTL